MISSCDSAYWVVLRLTEWTRATLAAATTGDSLGKDVVDRAAVVADPEVVAALSLSFAYFVSVSHEMKDVTLTRCTMTNASRRRRVAWGSSLNQGELDGKS